MSAALIVTLSLAGAFRSFAQTVPPKEDEAKLIAVLKSDASRKDKADACRQLALVGTREAIAPLAALLGDEELSHMARYALEPIPDPAVDGTLRDALAKLKGRPLVGVIGSIGVRRDARAVDAMARFLKDPDAEVAQAAARALGSIGDAAAAKSLQAALPGTPAANRLAFCEGLFRCAEALAAGGRRDQALALYDQLRNADLPHQVRAGALRGTLLISQADAVPLLRQHLRSQDYILFSAAVQTTQEMPGSGVTQVLTAELDQMPADNKILVIQTLAMRRDAAALPALFAAAKTGAKPVRLAAVQALPVIGQASAVAVVVGLLDDTDRDIAHAAQEALGAIPGQEADAAVMSLFHGGDSGKRLTSFELIGRRRMATSIPELLKAAGDADARIRPAALKTLGELGGPAELQALLDLLGRLKASQDLNVAEQALIALCAKADDSESCVEKLTGPLGQAQPSQKGVLLRVLAAVGGMHALEAVRGAVKDANPDVRAAAVRSLCTWKTADVAPDLLALANTSDNPVDKILSLRALLGLAGRPDLPAEKRLSLCRQASDLIQQAGEKRLLLAALGTIDSPDVLAMILPYLADPAIQDEAGTALAVIAGRLLKAPDAATRAPQLIEPLEKLTQVTRNDDLARRAKELLRRAKELAGR